MTVGEKIRKYRLLCGKTQKELGLDLGFTARTADVRVNQYEKDKMAPKAEIRNRIAEVLGVHPSALSDVDIQSEIDVLRVLFLLEEQYHMKIERTEDQTTLTFDNHDPSMDGLNSLLYAWHVQNKTLNAGQKKSADPGAEEHKYDVWKSRFPMDLEQYFDEQEKKLSDFYQPLVKKNSYSYGKISLASEFLEHLRKMINAGIHVFAGRQVSRSGHTALALTFLLSEIDSSSDTLVTEAMTHFLFDMKTLVDYGMQLDLNFFENEGGTRLTFTLRLPSFANFSEIINSIQDFESSKPHGNYETSIFEQNIHAEMSVYDFNVKERINGENRL